MSPTSSKSVLSVDSLWEFEKVDYSKENENHLLLKIKGDKPTEEKERKPVAIQGVIDCSGSMGWEQKMDYARRTLKVLVDHLKDDDYLGLTGFSTTAWEIAPLIRCDTQGKDQLKTLIGQIVDTNSTNISGGLYDGCAALRSKDLGTNYLQRVLLLSDGQPNQGVHDSPGLVDIAKKECGEGNPFSLSCLGYGNDHDPELLAGMAKAGRGNFHYISTPDKAPEALGTEIGGLLSVVAQNIKVELEPASKVEVLEVLNDYDVETSGGVTTLKVDDVYAEEVKPVVIKFNLPKKTKAVAARPSKVLDVKLSYVDVASGDRVDLRESIKVEFVKNGSVSTTPNEEVEKQIAMLELAQAQNEAIEDANNGKYDDAKSKVMSGLDKIKKCAVFAKDKVLQGMADDVEKMVPQYESVMWNASAGAKAFSYSNASSLMRGRATVGSSANLYSGQVTDSICAMADSMESAVEDSFDEDPGVGTAGTGFPPSGTVIGTSYPPNVGFPPDGGTAIPTPPIPPVVSSPPVEEKKKPTGPYSKRRTKSSR